MHQQRSTRSTHQLGGILDLAFHSKVSKSVSGVPLPIATSLSFVFNFRSFKVIGRKSKIGTTVDKKIIWVWYVKVS